MEWTIASRFIEISFPPFLGRIGITNCLTEYQIKSDKYWENKTFQVQI